MHRIVELLICSNHDVVVRIVKHARRGRHATRTCHTSQAGSRRFWPCTQNLYSPDLVGALFTLSTMIYADCSCCPTHCESRPVRKNRKPGSIHWAADHFFQSSSQHYSMQMRLQYNSGMTAVSGKQISLHCNIVLSDPAETALLSMVCR